MNNTEKICNIRHKKPYCFIQKMRKWNRIEAMTDREEVAFRKNYKIELTMATEGIERD